MGPLLLLIAAAIWGGSFAAQKATAVHLGPFAVLFSRSFIAGIFLHGCVCVAARRKVADKSVRSFSRQAIVGGALGGAVLFLASLAQQIGIAQTTAGASAFLTANYILFVPVIGAFIGRKTSAVVWTGVAVALFGSYLLCVPAGGGFSIGAGDAWTVLCAVLFAAQILVVDRFAPGTDVIAFSCVQQFAGAALALPFLFIAGERAHYAGLDFSAVVFPILWLAILSSGVAYTCQNLGQTKTKPAIAAIIMSLESVFGMLSGYLVFGEVLSVRQAIGCALVFVAATSASLAERRN